MLRKKKFIVISVLVAVLVFAGIGGVVVAQTGTPTQPGAAPQALLDRVIKIYQQKTGVAIDRQKLDESFAQARRDIQDEALKNRLQRMVSDNRTTQAEADQYYQWWKSRPNTPAGPGFGGHMMGPRGGFRGSPGPGMGMMPGLRPPPPQVSPTPAK